MYSASMLNRAQRRLWQISLIATISALVCSGCSAFNTSNTCNSQTSGTTICNGGGGTVDSSNTGSGGDSSAGSGGQPPSVSGVDGNPRFAGELLIGPMGMNLDTDPPSPTQPLDMHGIYGSKPGFGVNRSAYWKESGEPTRDQCVSALATQPLEYSTVFTYPDIGFAICMQSESGRPAYGRVEQVTNDGIQMYVIVWQAA
jgi:hypothetical protein